MRDFTARRRRCLALALLASLLTIPALAQTKPLSAGTTGPAGGPASSSSLMAVHDGRGSVTVIADQASVREVFRVLSRWFDFPTLNIDTLPDVRVPVRFERMPVAQAAQRLLRLAGLPAAPVTPRARPAGARRSPFIAVHDGHGLVTVMGEQASTREVMSLLSRWFAFPVVNADAIPEARGTIRFERVPVSQLVDRLLRSASLNYVILTNPRTSVPSKVVAAPLSADRTGTAPPASFPAGNEGNPTPGWPGPANIVYPPVNPGAPMPMPMPVQVPVDPAMPMLPFDPATVVPAPSRPIPPGTQPNESPQPGTAGAAPGAPGANRPGVMTPATPPKPPG